MLNVSIMRQSSVTVSQVGSGFNCKCAMICMNLKRELCDELKTI